MRGHRCTRLKIQVRVQLRFLQKFRGGGSMLFGTKLPGGSPTYFGLYFIFIKKFIWKFAWVPYGSSFPIVCIYVQGPPTYILLTWLKTICLTRLTNLSHSKGSLVPSWILYFLRTEGFPVKSKVMKIAPTPK